MSRKKRRIYVCDACGYESPAWFGRCPSCGTWNSAISMSVDNHAIIETSKEVANIRSLSDIKVEDSHRLFTGLNEFDRALGGGVVPGSVVLVSGEPGIGKSTLMLQVAERMVSYGKVLYISGEESQRQIKLRAHRLKLGKMENIEVSATTELDFLEKLDLKDYSLLIFDSLQTLRLSNVASLPGSFVQVRECANFVVSKAKESNIAAVIVGHVTKGGQIAGPKLVEHIVDTVLYFDTNKSGYRFLRTVKNRFGPSDEIAVFEMTSDGLAEVPDISDLFVKDFIVAPGNVITAVSEGSKTFLVEVQSLVSKPIYGTPRRLATGVPIDRVLLVAAVLSKRANIPLDNLDLYINIAGGIQVDDPGTDLAIALSLLSSFTNKAVPQGMAAFGEIGLDGTVRNVTGSSKRIDRLKESGFSEVLSPNGNIRIQNIADLVRFVGGMSDGS